MGGRKKCKTRNGWPVGHSGQSYRGLLHIGKPLTENVFIKMSILDYEFGYTQVKDHQLVCFFTRPYALGRSRTNYASMSNV